MEVTVSSNPFKKVICTFKGKLYEIRVYRSDEGFSVITYYKDQPAFSHGYFCNNASDSLYEQQFGKKGWQRLIYCAKADITGKKIYRPAKPE